MQTATSGLPSKTKSYQVKRLQPIKASELKNAEVASPMTQLGQKHVRINNNNNDLPMLRPSPSLKGTNAATTGLKTGSLAEDLKKVQAIY